MSVFLFHLIRKFSLVNLGGWKLSSEGKFMTEYILLYNTFVSVNFKVCVYLHLSSSFVMLSENLVYDIGLSYTTFVSTPGSTKLVPHESYILVLLLEILITKEISMVRSLCLCKVQLL